MGAPFPASPAWHVRARVGPAVCVGVAPALPLLENPALQRPGEPARLRMGAGGLCAGGWWWRGGDRAWVGKEGGLKEAGGVLGPRLAACGGDTVADGMDFPIAELPVLGLCPGLCSGWAVCRHLRAPLSLGKPPKNKIKNKEKAGGGAGLIPSSWGNAWALAPGRRPHRGALPVSPSPSPFAFLWNWLFWNGPVQPLLGCFWGWGGQHRP